MYYLSDICALCLVPNQNMRSIVSKDTDGTMIEEKLRSVLLEIINYKPNVEKYICDECLLDINFIHKFRLKCLNNITKLNEYAPYKNLTNQADIKKEHLTLPKNLNENETVVIKSEEIEKHSASNDSFQLGNQNNNEICLKEYKMQKNEAIESVFIKEESTYESFPMDTTPYESFVEFNEEKHIIDDNSNDFCSTTYGTNHRNIDPISSSNIVEPGRSNLHERQFTTDFAIADKLPNRSKNRYEKQYTVFCEWRKAKGSKGVNQDLILEFLNEQSVKYKPSSLWAFFSMLKKTLISYENVNIGNFSKVSSFLKTKSLGFVSKKSADLSRAEIEKFLREAPNEEYLLIKAITIFGVFGGCRRQELCDIKLQNVKKEGTVLVVRIPDTKTQSNRTFTILPDGNGFNPVHLLQLYTNLRPKHVKNDRFFLSYRNNKCTIQPVGIKAIGRFPSIIAKYLGLENASSYTGHCYRRTAASLLANADVLTLKRHGFWKSTVVDDDSIKIAKIMQSGCNESSIN